MGDKNRVFGRRSYLGKVATGVGSIALLSNAASAKKNNNIKWKETENGVLISTTHSSGLVRPDINDVREEVIPENSNAAVSELDSVINEDPSDKKIGYYLGWVDNAPYERFWSAPPTASAKEKEHKINDAQKTVLGDIEKRSNSTTTASASSNSITTTSTSGDGISASPDWDALGTVTADEYARITVDGTEYILGRVDLTGRLYETHDVSGDRQLGCVVSFLQWPGEYLDSYDSSVSNGQGFNIETFVEQDWSYDGTHNKSIVDFAPTKDKDGGYNDALDLESVSFGADASGPYGSITLSPSDDNIDKLTNETDPDNSVNTRYEYGGIMDVGNAGGDSVVRAGNSGVFHGDWDENESNIVLCKVSGTFNARGDLGTGNMTTVDPGYVFSGY
ncbi:hypothetical protein [Natrinema sp. CBA1119]|uniref:hypothetical protein n=1 Tax=Natrinema sp. CBA1119 TaxID=1608465 RepID=UPI0011453228|nr:hypothetical protein [Natrinema sp. CBA1119]